jgi:hypothetical protein
MKRKTLIAVALLCFVVVCFAAIADLSGKWTGKITTPDGNPLQLNYLFKVNGDKLTGTAQGDGTPDSIYEGKITGNDISFKVSNDNGDVFPHTGKYFADGDSISMNIDVRWQKFHTTLKRADK